MKVFISWSGELSREIAEAVRVWLPGVLQAVKPYFTPDDIEKGARWSSEIASELEDSKVGIFCITRENLESSWIVFEAGAISKVVGKGAVCPILFGVENSDLSGPLGQFQATSFEKKDFFKLVKSINSELSENRLPEDTLTSVFDMWWPNLEEKVNAIIKSHSQKQPEELRSEREILEEVLGLVRMISKMESSQVIESRRGAGKSSMLSELLKARADQDIAKSEKFEDIFGDVFADVFKDKKSKKDSDDNDS